MREPLNVQSFTPDCSEAANDRPFVNVLWPCLLHTVAMQCEQKSVNLFEKAVLRLFEAGMDDRQAQADTLCLERDLVEFICLRLEQKQLLDGNALTKHGERFLDGIMQGEETSTFIYSEMLGLKQLPFASVTKPQFLMTAGQDNIYYLGDIGDTKNKLSAPLVLKPTQPQTQPQPQLSTSQVLELLRRFETLHRSTPLLPKIERDLPRFILTDSASIAIQPKAQLIYLHCVCVLEDDSSVQVLNPFGYADAMPELTLSLQSYSDFDALKEKLLDKALDKAYTRQVPSEQQTHSPRMLKLSGYVELDAEINRAQDLLDQYRQLTAQQQQHDSRKEESLYRGYISAVYSAFEYMLRRIYQQSREATFDRLLVSTDAQQISSYEQQALTEMGIKLNKSNASFVAVSPEEIASAQAGNGSLRSLLTLNLCSTQNPAAAAWRVVAAQNADFLETLRRLKDLRDPISHGQSADKTDLAEMESFASLLHMWLNAWRQQTPATPAKVVTQTDTASATSSPITPAVRSPSSFEVERALLEFFPQAKRNRLSDKTLHELLLAEFGFQSAGILPQETTTETATAETTAANVASVPTQCLTTLAGFYQRLLQDFTSLLPPTITTASTAPHGNFSREAKDAITATVDSLYTKCQQAGLKLEQSALPQPLVAAVRKVYKGNKQLTLGTALVLWLQSVKPEHLASVAHDRPYLLENAVQLIELRAHGQGVVAADAAAKLRKEIYADCAAMLGE